MRKHFLILMLMALLPLAGWAADLNVTLQIGEETASASITAVYKGDPYQVKVLVDGTQVNGATPAEGYKITWDREGFTEYGVYTCTVTKAGDEGSATLTITKAPLEVKAKAYQVAYSGNPVKISDLYEVSDGKTWKTAADKNLLKESAVQINWLSHDDQPTDAGAYDFTIRPANLTNYTVTVAENSANATLSITKLPVKATVTVTSPSNRTLTYGEATLTNPAWTVAYKTVADEPQTVTATPLSESFTVKTSGDNPVNFYAEFNEDGTPKTVKGNAGTYTITPVTVFKNYEVTETATASFTINKKKINSSWIKLDKSEFTFNNTVQKPTVKVMDGEKELDIKAGDSDTDYDVVVTIPESKDAKSYDVTITAGNSGNYEIAANTKATYKIEKAPLVLIIKDNLGGKAKTYDGSNLADVKVSDATKISDYATIYNNVKNDNNVWQTVQTTTGSQLPSGEGQNPSGEGQNPSEGSSSTSATPLITFHIVPNETGEVDEDGNPITTLSEAGEYVIDAIDFNAPNYDVQVQKGTYTITGAKIQLVAADAEKTYGEADPTFTYWVKMGDNVIKTNLAKYIKTAPTSITRSDAGVNKPGEYVITASADAVATDNYQLESTTVNGKFTINKKAVTILAKAGEKVYDGAEPKLDKEKDFEVLTTLVGNDKVTAVTLYKEAGVDAGEYDVTPSKAEGISEDYYKINYMVGTYTIKPRRLTKIEIANQTINKNGQASDLSKDKVTFTADDYTLTNADIKKLQSEFEYEFNGVSSTENETTTAKLNAIRIKYATVGGTTLTKFTNFSLPLNPTTSDPDATIILNAGASIDGKYILGALTIKGTAPASGSYTDFADNATAADKKAAKLIEDLNGQRINVKVVLNRDQVLGTTNCNWAAEKWNTLCLPFDVTVREISKQLGYAIVNVVDANKTTTGNVQFKLKMSGTIKANTPFTVKTDEAIANGTELTFDNKTIEQGAASVDAGCGYEFVGVYADKKLTKDDYQLSFLRGNGDKWVYIGNDSKNTWTLVPFSAYVDLTPAGTSAHEVTFTMEEADGSTTVIRNISAETAAKMNAEGWYTINGMKLDAAPTEKGVYINNGKKVVLK